MKSCMHVPSLLLDRYLKSKLVLQWRLLCNFGLSYFNRKFGYQDRSKTSAYLYIPQCSVRPSFLHIVTITYFMFSLISVMLIGLPASTPMKLRNSAKFTFGDFENSAFAASYKFFLTNASSNLVAWWLCIHSKLSCTACECLLFSACTIHFW